MQEQDVSCGRRCSMNFKQLGLLVGLSLINHQAWSACDVVAQLAGESYQTAERYAATTSLLDHDQPITQVGVWHIYYQDSAWFETCAPIEQNGVAFFPVLQKQNQFSVISGVFVIKTFREPDIHLIAERYGFKALSALPNRFSAVFDVNPSADYDALLKRLDYDKDIERVAPVLIEATSRR